MDPKPRERNWFDLSIECGVTPRSFPCVNKYMQYPWVNIISIPEDIWYPWVNLSEQKMNEIPLTSAYGILTGTDDIPRGYWWYSSRGLRICHMGNDDVLIHHVYCMSSRLLPVVFATKATMQCEALTQISYFLCFVSIFREWASPFWTSNILE